ncbi:hypothetical protein [Paenarthrobacter aromaticivorans]|uniref:Uncharacterized protein n=1 Tax=Paenarthrobacter aromaticivorans TaxID=2849150 RepID=A0ABS6I595_9MICC|nr:hypothetical protein [Paenarthrobacter sp. MMS21-TAE1-1]MBU8865597.1 hypothetical protein [Paenarthrobacter sp. MMS21-TAE1-1]
MQANPVLKPKVATPALIVTSAVTLALALMLAATTFTFPVAGWALVLVVAVGLVLSFIWYGRIRDYRVWQTASRAQWELLESLKRSTGTTTEVTVVSVDSPQPTGAWITIRWNRFDYLQPAWIEALSEPIWPGSVLLIRPDPAQIRPGMPWPPTYSISGKEVLGWAPRISGLRKTSGLPYV